MVRGRGAEPLGARLIRKNNFMAELEALHRLIERGDGCVDDLGHWQALSRTQLQRE